MRNKRLLISISILAVLIVLVTAIWKNKHHPYGVLALPQFESNEERVRLEHEALKGSGDAADRISSVLGLFPNSDALFWSTIAAENNSRNGAYNLSSNLSDPGMRGVDVYGNYKRDREFFWLQKAVHGVDPKLAIETLKLEFTNPKKMQPEPDAVIIKWKLTKKMLPKFKCAAMRGSPEAAYRLFEYFRSIDSEGKEIQFWAIIAAQNGHHRAPAVVGKLMLMSSNPRDRERAQFWIRKATKNASR